MEAVTGHQTERGAHIHRDHHPTLPTNNHRGIHAGIMPRTHAPCHQEVSLVNDVDVDTLPITAAHGAVMLEGDRSQPRSEIAELSFKQTCNTARST